MDIIISDYLENSKILSSIYSDAVTRDNILLVESIEHSMERMYSFGFEDSMIRNDGNILAESIWSNMKSGVASIFATKQEELDMKLVYVDKHIDDDATYYSIKKFKKVLETNRTKVKKIFDAVVDGVFKTVSTMGDAFYSMGSFRAGPILSLIPFILNIVFSKIIFLSYAGFRLIGFLMSAVQYGFNPIYRLITYVATKMSISENGLKIKQRDGHMRSFYDLECEGIECVDTIYHMAHNKEEYIKTQMPELHKTSKKLNDISKSLNYTFNEISKKSNKNLEREKAKMANNYKTII